MKKLFKGAVPTLALLLVAVMSLTSVTYAWFTAGNAATVDAIDVNVKSVDGLLVSLNGFNGTWGSSMSPTFSGAQPLQDVSSSGEVTAEGNLVFYTVGYDNVFDAITSSTKTTLQTDSGNSNDNYRKFDFFIKNDSSAAITVKLTGSTVTGDALSKAAVRVALVNQGTASSIALVNNGTAPNISGTPSLIGIWEPNQTSHTSDGVTWLENNGQSGNTSGKANYMAVNGELAVSNPSQNFVNVATGETYSIVSSAIAFSTLTIQQHMTTDDPPVNDYDYYSVDSLPDDGEYFVYDETAGIHFKRITIDNFFKPLNAANAVDGTGKAIAGVYTKDTASGEYRVVPVGSTISSAVSYYQAATVGTGTNDVTAYVRSQYKAATVAFDGNAASYNKSSLPNEDYYTFTYDAVNSCYAPKTYGLADYFTELTETEYNAAKADETTAIWVLSGTDADTFTYTKKVTAEDKTGLGAFAANTYYKLASHSAYTKDASTLKNVTTEHVSADTFTDGDFSFTIPANTIEKLSCYIWVEGQDCDCTNYVAVADTPFTVNLKLTK